MNQQNSTWAIVPAAGIGKRMGGDTPKQYLPLNGGTLLEQTLERLLSMTEFEKILVAINPFDEQWKTLPVRKHEKIETALGGPERFESVFNALIRLEGRAHILDWVVIHDAARPCVTVEQIQHLLHEVKEHAVGGLLAVPVSDTLKRINDDYGIEGTIDRQYLWHAQTPQVFRYGVLKEALKRAGHSRHAVTDESTAVEQLGYCPIVVEGRRDNIKVTHPEDLRLAELILQSQQAASITS